MGIPFVWGGRIVWCRCPYCVAMAPIYEQAAALVYKQSKGSHEIVLASVNCVDKENFQVELPSL